MTILVFRWKSFYQAGMKTEPIEPEQEPAENEERL
jgi:hypothetical protein